jgi:hypothetical protein
MTVFAGKLMEPVMLQIRSILQTNLPTMIDTINAEHEEEADAFDLEDPLEYYIGQLQVVNQLPAIVLWPIGDASVEWSNDTILFKPRITIWSALTDTDEERLNRRLYRMQDAIIRTLKDTDTLEGQVDFYDIVGVDFRSPWPIADASFCNAHGVVIEVNNEETF